MKKYLLVLLLIVFIIPSIAFASWWNPFSWFKNKTTTVPQANFVTQLTNSTATPKDDSKAQIEALQKQITDLKNQKSNPSPIKNVSPKTDTIITTPKFISVVPTVYATSPVDLQKICTDLKTEASLFDTKYTEIIALDDSIETLINQANPPSFYNLKGIDFFVQYSKNWANMYDEFHKQISTLKGKIEDTYFQDANFVSKYFPNANPDYISKINLSSMDEEIYLDGYYNPQLDYLNWVVSNPVWNDYYKVKAKEMSGEVNGVFEKYMVARNNATDDFYKIKNAYTGLLKKNNCSAN